MSVRKAKTWKEHFDTVLNKEAPVRPIQLHKNKARHQRIDIGAFRPAEVKTALVHVKWMKGGIAVGYYIVVIELHKNRFIK